MGDQHRLPPLAALRVFEAVARLASFTKAAGELGMTQAAVSYQVKVLEERAGAPLFLRRPRGIVLTETGRALAPAATDAFERIGAAWAAATGDAGEVLRVTTTLTFAASWLARRLGAFQIAHPLIAVRLDTSQEQRDFARDEVDVAIRVGRGDWPGLAVHPLFASDFTPMLSPALAASLPGGLREPADLLGLPLVNPDDPWWRTWFAAAGLAFEPAQVRSAGGDLGAQVYDAGAALGGQGVAVLTLAFYGDELADGRLVQPFGLVCREDGYWLAYPEARRNALKIRAFRDWLLSEAAKGAAGTSAG
jgi:LysR family transcriptional regulator, glycine cleavage system transcriptional activator